MKIHFPAIAFLTFLLFAACHDADCDCEKPADKTAASAQPAPARYPFTGRVVAVVPERHALLVAHEAIPGLMGAMTMEFTVDATALNAAAPGSRVAAALVHEGDIWRLVNVTFAPPVAP